MSNNEKKPPVDSSTPNDDAEEEELTEEELADVTAGAGAVVPRKVDETAVIQKKWLDGGGVVTMKPKPESEG